MQYINTLDLDKIDKQQLKTIEQKIKSNSCCLSINHKDSSTKGYHVMFICSKKCDICRFVFDDAMRYEIDFGREEKFKNVLFDNKEYFRSNLSNLIVCEKCRKYGNSSMMSKREIDLNTIRIKVKIGRIPLMPTFVYLSYNYFECPICHWFKFVKKPIKEII